MHEAVDPGLCVHRVIGIEADNIDVCIARVAFKEAVFIKAVVRRVGVQEVLHSLFVPQVFYRVTIQADILGRRALASPPPEPAAGVLMERTENNWN
ncbi:hypothetical protein D3C78_1609640 [compost metagenome]